MVTAGIYMIARSHAIFNLAPHALEIVAIIGLSHRYFAATMGLAQTDIKRVLAYSTVSQLWLHGHGLWSRGLHRRNFPPDDPRVF